MKKLVVIAVALVMALSMCVSAFAAGEQNPAFNARLVGVNAPASTVFAGSSFSVGFMIEAPNNYGGRAVATISGSGFTVDGALATKEFNGVTENTSYLVPVFCAADTATGRYPVVLSVEYTVGDETVTMSQNLNINVSGKTDPVVPDDKGDVYLSVTSVPNSSVAAGDSFTVGFTSSIGGIYSYNYGYGYGYSRGTVSVSGSGFSLAGTLAEQDINSGSNSISVLTDSGMETGRHQMTITVTYTVNGEKYTASKTLNIDVIGNKEEEIDESKDAANFKLSSATIPEKIGKSELSTTLKLTFKNDSKFDAENVKIRLGGLGDIILNTFTDVADAGGVKAGDSITASFPIKFPEFPKAQSAMTAEVIFDTAAGEKTQSFNVYLQAKEKSKEDDTPESGSLKPKVIVKNYSVDVENVTSGEEFTLSFTLENTSAEKDLRNMTVDITPKSPSSTNGQSSGPVFSFIDGASSFYTPVLEKGSTKEYSIRLKCSASAGAGSYPIGISFDFEYANAGGYSSGSGAMDVNLPVVQPIKFELMEWTPPTECGLDGTSISFQYFNKSRNPMTSLSITVEGDFTMPTQYVGTLAASSYDQFGGTITPNEGANVGDTKTAVLVFTFEDAAGNEGRLEYPFDVEITESSGGDMMGGDMMGDMMGGDMPIMDDFMDPGMPADGDGVDSEKTGMPTWAKIGIPAVVVIAAIIAAVVISKKVKAKRELEDDED